MDGEGQLSSWSDFTNDILKHFDEGSYAVPARRLSKLFQIDFVKEYQTKFEGMSTKVHGMSRKVLKEVFISGLNPEVEIEVLRVWLESINDALDLARMWEDTYVVVSQSILQRAFMHCGPHVVSEEEGELFVNSKLSKV